MAHGKSCMESIKMKDWNLFEVAIIIQVFNYSLD